jgi:hypothetical protein
VDVAVDDRPAVHGRRVPWAGQAVLPVVVVMAGANIVDPFKD